MAGIIINIPTPQLINPTSEFIPVNNAGLFVDSNIKNIVNDKIETKNVFDEIIGLKLNLFFLLFLQAYHSRHLYFQ